MLLSAKCNFVVHRQREVLHLLLRRSDQLSTTHLFQIHTQLLISPIPFPFSVDPTRVAAKLIDVFASHANLRHAVLIFSQTTPNIFSYNAILKAFSHNNHWLPTLHYFNRMLLSSAHPDEYTFTSVLKACAGLRCASDAQKMHAVISKLGFESNLFVRNSVIDMYFKLGFFLTAHILFEEMPERDVVSWNTLLSGFCLQGRMEECRRVFSQMREKNLVSWSTIINGYAKLGMLQDARKLFDEMPQRNIVSWNAMISGYAQNAEYADALRLFRQMQEEGRVSPNDVTLISVLPACAHLGALDLGKWIEGFIRRQKLELGLFLGNALADMYAKCGCMVEAIQVFNRMRERDAISWSIIITGSAMHGLAEHTFWYFSKMLESGVKPDEVTLIGLLTACSHAGLADKGLGYFHMMEGEYGIAPTIEHYGCVIDLLSRANRLDEAEDMIKVMPMKPNVIVWGALLGGCQIYKDAERGKRVAQQILELDPEHSGSHIYLANVNALAGRLDEAAQFRVRMRNHGVAKTPGCSWIEVQNTVHEFFMGDRSHPQFDDIYSQIKVLGQKMKLAGYKPDTDLVPHNVEEEEKEDALATHSERLAIAFGLISTRQGATIRVVKNLRICNDCHVAIKLISKIIEREIIVRDRSRFHHFKSGICSCNDYW